MGILGRGKVAVKITLTSLSMRIPTRGGAESCQLGARGVPQSLHTVMSGQGQLSTLLERASSCGSLPRACRECALAKSGAGRGRSVSSRRVRATSGFTPGLSRPRICPRAAQCCHHRSWRDADLVFFGPVGTLNQLGQVPAPWSDPSKFKHQQVSLTWPCSRLHDCHALGLRGC